MKYTLFSMLLLLFLSCTNSSNDNITMERKMKNLCYSIIFSPKNIIEIIDSSDFYSEVYRKRPFSNRFLLKCKKYYTTP
jgi:hypothetical protein